MPFSTNVLLQKLATILSRSASRKLAEQYKDNFTLQGAELTGASFQQNNTGWSSNNGDPYFVFSLKRPTKTVRLRFWVKSEKPSVAQLFFTTSAGKEGFSPDSLYYTGATGTLFDEVIAFSEPVTTLRFDPVDHSLPFEILDFYLETLQEELPASNSPFGWVPGALLFKKITPQKTLALFTHDGSASGAPMMIRKIGEQLRTDGLDTVVVSFEPPQAQDFLKAATLFLVCPPETHLMEELAAMLAKADIPFALLNTVVTGSWAPPLHLNGICCVGLVHEMFTAIHLLKAENNCIDMQQHCKHLVFPSVYVLADFEAITSQKLDKKQTVILPYGYYHSHEPVHRCEQYNKALKKKLNLPDNAVLLCGSGVVHIAKGLDIMALVVANLQEYEKQQGCETHLVWLGHTSQPEYKMWVESQFYKMGLANRLHFIGYIADENEYAETLAGTDVFVLPSREDSMPSVLLEAMAAKLPIVAFEGSGGAQSLLQDGRGLLASYMNASVFAQHIETLLNDPALCSATLDSAYDYFKSTGNFQLYVLHLLNLFENFKEECDLT